jgi:hypothetical protein
MAEKFKLFQVSIYYTLTIIVDACVEELTGIFVVIRYRAAKRPF